MADLENFEPNDDVPPAQAAEHSGWPSWAWPALATAAIVGLLISNVFLLLQINDTSDDVTSIGESLDRIDNRIDGVANDSARAAADAASAAEDADAAVGALGQIDSRLDAVEARPVVGAPGTGVESTAPPIDSGGAGLPVFAGDPTTDPAVGLVIADLAGFEYYDGQEAVFDLTDGRSRAIVVWAHWCPFCQDELPGLSEWVEANAADFPGFELISITTAIDETAPNPLIPYLDDNQFPFPVLVDDDSSLSAQMSVSACPFWLFTGPDGAVVGRLQGLTGMDTLANIFGQLDDIATG
jgi:thiol-disulfide isomerase/thioredoxin